jgi:hypothetical protein
MGGLTPVETEMSVSAKLRTGVRWMAVCGWWLTTGLLGANSASVVRLELHPESGQVALLHRNRAVGLYEFRPSPRKPCLSLLGSIEGINVLEDTTSETPYIRGLSLGFEVNGVSFSQDGDGWQRSGPEITRTIYRDPQGRPVAELSHTVYWVPTRTSPATRESAWLIEDRRLRFGVDEFTRETSVEWQSELEVGPAADQVTVAAPTGSGLTLRLIPAFRPRSSPEIASLSGETEQEHAQGDRFEEWSAMTAHIAGRELTVTCFDHPAPPATSQYRMQTDPFTMMSTAHGLESQPWLGWPGDRFRVRVLVTVRTGEVTGQALTERRERWIKP